MFFKTADSQKAGEPTIVCDQTTPFQIKMSQLLANLFHFKHRTTAYFHDLERFESVSLFIKNVADNTVLNDLFFYILSVPGRQLAAHVIHCFSHPLTITDVEAFRSTLQCKTSKSGPGLQSSPYFSKTCAANFSALAAAMPYCSTIHIWNKLERRFTKA